MAELARPPDVERVLALKTVREATARGHFLAAVREYGRDGSDCEETPALHAAPG